MAVERCDLAIVGAGPAGAAAALGALRARPDLSVLLLDRADFPRDKVCGDGIAPHVIELLADAGVHGVVEDTTPVRRLRLERTDARVDRQMARPAWVVPREVFDARLVAAAETAGARLVRHRARAVAETTDGVRVDGLVEARVLVGADGAHSVVRRTQSASHPSGRSALAIRGYAPTPPSRRGLQLITFGTTRQPSYAWSFDRGDGLANVGYGELLTARRSHPTRADLLSQLDTLLPGASDDGSRWRAHHLPLSSARWSPPRGRTMLVGDAAGLINPLTGEGIYYAVLTGLLAGSAAAQALTGPGADGTGAGASYRASTQGLLSRHLRHTALAARLTLHDPLLRAGLLAADTEQPVFDDLVEIGLGRGRITPRLVRGIAGHLLPTLLPHHRIDRGR